MNNFPIKLENRKHLQETWAGRGKEEKIEWMKEWLKVKIPK